MNVYLSVELGKKQKSVCQILVPAQLLTPPVALGSTLESLDHVFFFFSFFLSLYNSGDKDYKAPKQPLILTRSHSKGRNVFRKILCF